MGKYTEFLEEQTYNIFDEEDYMEELHKVNEKFRSFDKALDTFIIEHGYRGSDNADEKVKFISEKFRESEIPVPRNIKKWYSESKRIERKTAFQICFVFKLHVEEVDDFFRRVCLFRGFDCHDVEEIVYFFCFKNELCYSKAMEILDRIPRTKQGKIEMAEEAVYTNYIVEEIDDLLTEGELVDYLSENVTMFSYNNVTAYSIIKKLWREIESKKGLAYREKQNLYTAFDMDEDQLEKQTAGGRKERARDYNSIWEIYLRILGLEGNYTSKFYKVRSIKNMLKDNELLHPLTEDAFPDRDGLTKILNGEHISHERVRKILILLLFYRFWVSKALDNNNYEVSYGDTDRFLDSVNDFLLDAGYPTLYPGNPFDFIILVSINGERPLTIFREYMREMYFVKDEEVCIHKSK